MAYKLRLRLMSSNRKFEILTIITEKVNKKLVKCAKKVRGNQIFTLQ